MFDAEALKAAMAELDEEAVLAQSAAAVAEGGAKAAMDACQAGLAEVGGRFDAGEYFVSDLIFAGEVMSEAVEILKPALIGGASGGQRGRLILCTVKGDLHDIGKNIVRAMLEAAGFAVLDLGIDVPPETIVEKAKEENIGMIALSGVLTLALDSMKATVDAFTAAGLRGQVKILIGGNPTSAEACAAIGADDWGHSPQKAVDVCGAWAS